MMEQTHLRRVARSTIPLTLLLVVAFGQGRGEQPELTNAQKQEVIDSAWKDVHDLFYDTGFRGVKWDDVRRQFINRVDEAHTRQELADLVRQMIATLHNSHSGFLTDQEYRQTLHVLPFFFDSVSGRVFVSYVFRPRDSSLNIPLRFGDEIISVNQHPAKNLRLPSVTHLDPVMSNPYYGPAKSAAALRIRRGNTVFTVNVPRVQRFADVIPLEVRKLDDGVVYLRFLKMDNTAIAPEVLKSALQQASESSALIIDLRHCVGGDAAVLDVIGGMLLGAGLELQRKVPRGMSPSDKRVTVEHTVASSSVYKGKVILLVDGNTESGPEVLAVALHEYSRAQIVGERTKGAFNGANEAMDLLFNAGILLVPVDRSVSPHGNEYEGVGIAPDVASRNSEADFQTGRDAVEATAHQLLTSP
jgi:C-terminal processing protease CtpA/Prc